MDISLSAGRLNASGYTTPRTTVDRETRIGGGCDLPRDFQEPTAMPNDDWQPSSYSTVEQTPAPSQSPSAKTVVAPSYDTEAAPTKLLSDEIPMGEAEFSENIDGFLSKIAAGEVSKPSALISGKTVGLALGAAGTAAMIGLAGVSTAVGAVAGAVVGAAGSSAYNILRAIGNIYGGQQHPSVGEAALEGAVVGGLVGAGVGALLSPAGAIAGGSVLVAATVAASGYGVSKLVEAARYRK